MTEVTLNTENFIHGNSDYENNYTVSFPKHIIDNLKRYYEQQNFEDIEFEDESGELINYAQGVEEVDAVLRHIVYVARAQRTYEVNIAFTVDARTAEEAEQIVTDELPWGLDYNLLSVEED